MYSKSTIWKIGLVTLLLLSSKVNEINAKTFCNKDNKTITLIGKGNKKQIVTPSMCVTINSHKDVLLIGNKISKVLSPSTLEKGKKENKIKIEKKIDKEKLTIVNSPLTYSFSNNKTQTNTWVLLFISIFIVVIIYNLMKGKYE